jgi:alpha-ketoglutarate-dependent taurine dioxygenase
MAGLTMTPVDTECGISRFDIQVLIWDVPEGLSGTIEYSTDLFDEATIRRMGELYKATLLFSVERPDAAADDLVAMVDREDERRRDAEHQVSKRRIRGKLKALMGPSIGKVGRARRQTIGGSQEQWIKTEPSFPGKNDALLVTPAVDGIDLVDWARQNAEYLEDLVLKHGVVWFHGFAIPTVERFEEFTFAASSSGALEYKLRAGPRRQVKGRVYTSTDYPKDQSIFPHNEGAFQPEFPGKLFFYSVTPAETGGETPIGDNRKITARIPDEIIKRFVDRGGVLYRRNFGGRFGLPWQRVFSTEDKDQVAAICSEKGVDFEWKGDDWVMTEVVGPALVKHPKTGESIWFNHATFFNISALPETIREGLLASFAVEDLPNNTYYGDGSPIEPETLEVLRAAYNAEMVYRPWHAQDLMIIDNILAVHARQPFTGERLTTVAMADPYNWSDVWA